MDHQRIWNSKNQRPEQHESAASPSSPSSRISLNQPQFQAFRSSAFSQPPMAQSEPAPQGHAMNEHIRIAEEAVTGWENAQAEGKELRKELEAAVAEKAALEAAAEELLQQAEKDKAVMDDARHRAELELRAVQSRLHAADKERARMRYEVHLLRRELQLRTGTAGAETGKSEPAAAESTHRQYLDSLRKVATLQAECHRLRSQLQGRRTVVPVASPTAASRASLSLSLSMSAVSQRDHEDAGDADDADDATSCADSWASALLSEITAARKDDPPPPSPTPDPVPDSSPSLDFSPLWRLNEMLPRSAPGVGALGSAADRAAETASVADVLEFVEAVLPVLAAAFAEAEATGQQLREALEARVAESAASGRAMQRRVEEVEAELARLAKAGCADDYEDVKVVNCEPSPAAEVPFPEEEDSHALAWQDDGKAKAGRPDKGGDAAAAAAASGGDERSSSTGVAANNGDQKRGTESPKVVDAEVVAKRPRKSGATLFHRVFACGAH